MPNYCNFTMKIVGKAGDVQTLADWLKNDYHYIKKGEEPNFLNPPEHVAMTFEDDEYTLLTNEKYHFFRVFDFDDSGGLEERPDGLYSMIGFGDCAWSVYSCMFDGVSTYYGDTKKDAMYAEHAITIPQASDILNLKVEIYSYEPGCCFAEHYLVDHGLILNSDEYSYQEIYLPDFGTKEEAEKCIGKPLTDDDWEREYYQDCEIDPHDPKWMI